MNTVSPDKNKKRLLFQWSNNHYNNNDDRNVRNNNKRNDDNNNNNNTNANTRKGSNTINYSHNDCNLLEVDDVFNGLLISLDMDGDTTSYNRSDIMPIDDSNSNGPKRKYRRINDTDRELHDFTCDELDTFDEDRPATPATMIDSFDMLTSSAFDDDVDISTRVRHNNRIKEIMGAVKKDYKKNVEDASNRLNIYKSHMFAPSLLEYIDKSGNIFKNINNRVSDTNTLEFKKNLYLLQAQAHYLHERINGECDDEADIEDQDDEEIATILKFKNYYDHHHEVVSLPVATQKSSKWV